MWLLPHHARIWESTGTSKEWFSLHRYTPGPLRSYLSRRLYPDHQRTAPASLQADILSYAFFLLMVGATFLL